MSILKWASKIGATKEVEAFEAEVSASIPPEAQRRVLRAVENLALALAWRLFLKLGIPAGVLVAVVITITGSQATGQKPIGVAGGDTTISLPTPNAPALLAQQDQCPKDKGWSYSPLIPPPGGSPPGSSLSAETGYVCRRDDVEITFYTGGKVTGYKGSRQMTDDEVKKEMLK